MFIYYILELKTNIKVKIVCVHVILYIHSHKGFFTNIAMATITTFPGTSLIPMETGLNRRKIFSFGAMPSPNTPGLAKTRQDLPIPDSRIGAFESSLYGTIIHAALTLLAYIK